MKISWPRKVAGNQLNPLRTGDWRLQLLSMNMECLVSASHQLALITSLPFVHTARRSCRVNVKLRSWDRRWLQLLERTAGNSFDSERFEEGEVVTRFP